MQNQPGAAPPVFVDRSGRRRRLTVIAGTAMGLGLLTSIALILAGLFFDAPVPVPGWPDSRPAQPVEAGLDDRAGLGESPSVSPTPITPSTAPAPTPARSVSPDATGTTPRTAQPARTDHPGQGDEHRSTAKPNRSPGKPQ
ncbi:hypothetical protein D7147_03625 [Micromonospora musae]|uniref:Uncharacterized protein n=1 Tax=Micromonospora musae TaxID=1894970 RepID=A0A3A9Y2B8_9ACTN|nr:hypothetical protein [Micromonospora musae]RKN24096.1 hypothetical protein D7147_03625 [Micromonospora musae]RKN31585.1 hypothetical protein D7044_14770 [Micromonospora musae]